MKQDYDPNFQARRLRLREIKDKRTCPKSHRLKAPGSGFAFLFFHSSAMTPKDTLEEGSLEGWGEFPSHA